MLYYLFDRSTRHINTRVAVTTRSTDFQSHQTTSPLLILSGSINRQQSTRQFPS